jgi:glucose/arabinose dehydrogenase
MDPDRWRTSPLALAPLVVSLVGAFGLPSLGEARRPARRPRAVILALLTAALLLPGAPALGQGVAVDLGPLAAGFRDPLFLAGPPDGSGDRWVVEQGGRIWRIDAAGAIDPQPVLDISERVLVHNERGLLGLAFHPDFAANGRFFVTYSQADDGATSISEFTLSRPPPPSQAPSPSETAATTEPPRPVEATERPLLVMPQIYTTHKGGMLAFDAQGMLLIGTGDGGSGNDPHGHGLDRWSLLGKLLRIDVDSGWPYRIPVDNGFADGTEGRAEIHAVGLRNPWRFSVDRLNGDIYIGDVGQSAWEEIDVLPRGTRRASFGWSDMEGPGCLGGRVCDPSAHIAPAIAYPHVSGDGAACAVIGGYAYRGSRDTLPQGTYLYGDYCSGTLWAVPVEDLVAGTAEPVVVGQVDPSHGQLRSFGEDEDGELYAVTSRGDILRVVAAGTAEATG